MALTINHLLKIKILSSAKIVAGKNAINNVVESINVMDAPDIAEWVKPGELLLTTAYVIKDNPQQMISLIYQLKEKGCAGLAVKTQRFISNFAEEVCQTADQCHFPLIELPMAPSFGEVINQTVDLILNTKNQALENAFQAHRKFTQLFLKGGSMTDIAQTLSALMEKEIVLLNPLLEVIGVSEDWDGKREEALLLSIVKQIEDGEFPVQHISSIYAAEDKQFVIYPVYSLNMIRGYIIVIFSPPLDEPAIPTMFLEQAANVICFESMKQYAIEESSRTLQRQFFRDFMEGHLSDDEILNRSTWYGLREDLCYWVCVAKRAGEHAQMRLTKHDEALDQQLKDGLAEQIKYVFRQESDVITTTLGEYVVILLGFESYSHKNEESIIDKLTKLQKKLYKTENRQSYSFGMGNFVDELYHIPQAYHEALRALQAGYEQYGRRSKPFIRTFRTGEVRELLRLIPTSKLKQFCKQTLPELAFTDQQEKKELLQTLQTYLDHHCQVTETAKQLYIHRNTVLYRLAKCEEILGVNLKEEPDETARIRLALLIYAIL